MGGFVEVSARLTGVGSSGGNYYLALNKTPYDNVPFSFSDRSVSLEPRSLGSSSVGAGSYYGNGHGTSSDGVLYALLPETVLPLNQDFILRIDYLTANSVQYSTFDAAMNPINSRSLTLADLPDRFHITIGAYLANVSFDDLTIGGNASIPEPVAGVAVIVGCMMLRRRPHRGERRTAN